MISLSKRRVLDVKHVGVFCGIFRFVGGELVIINVVDTREFENFPQKYRVRR
jgi:hypothetical protein